MYFLAGLGKRATSALIDYSIYYFIFFIYYFVASTPDESGELRVTGIYTLVPIIFWLIYFPFSEGLTQKTLGKHILGLRVTKENGREASLVIP